jgi:hypothetical protein
MRKALLITTDQFFGDFRSTCRMRRLIPVSASGGALYSVRATHVGYEVYDKRGRARRAFLGCEPYRGQGCGSRHVAFATAAQSVPGRAAAGGAPRA